MSKTLEELGQEANLSNLTLIIKLIPGTGMWFIRLVKNVYDDTDNDTLPRTGHLEHLLIEKVNLDVGLAIVELYLFGKVGK
jgi:hypothetical protein